MARRQALAAWAAPVFPAIQAAPGSARSGSRGILVEEDQGEVLAVDARWRGLHRLLQIGHDQVDARGQRLGLAGAQRLGQPVDLGIAHRLGEAGGLWDATDADHRGVGEIAECLEMVASLGRVGGDIGRRAVDQPVADRVHHRLVLGHGVADEMRTIRITHRDRAEGRQTGQVGLIGTGETLERIGSQMDRAVGGREEAKTHAVFLAAAVPA